MTPVYVRKPKQPLKTPIPTTKHPISRGEILPYIMKAPSQSGKKPSGGYI